MRGFIVDLVSALATPLILTQQKDKLVDYIQHNASLERATYNALPRMTGKAYDVLSTVQHAQNTTIMTRLKGNTPGCYDLCVFFRRLDMQS